ncbi:class I SAM-dependent methyltransferase [Mycolicibacterium aichiense]|uniref:S-adenosyl-L-methionine-dependent methyltransferase n=1 Tax=Mycolicibacterium aichiense TaxID=1799 RepID=A0AAD1HRL6_9MYCO|nr:class I SAM-dependent methyltransferase [Mycolicibacterium aichiense]MCV7016485.1 class I SAM-dependent methyltransferase [Mycolicibacterium aichiense]BBX09740.1 putative S-adenosyl-L-methionine-dependent methyltransferase [Mycolicibacterium aichiense]SUA14303.1 methyltransferase [Mycolicibacterium aichiense]
MTRTDNDTWDLASSVGATATLVAAARAAASREHDPLIDDPFAEPLVRAVGVDFFTKMASGDLPNPDDDSAMGVTRMTDNMAVRTKFFDEFFLGAADAGVRQVVILASGLDSRAYRLDWPAGMVVYEIDQPDVIAFKTQTLAEQGAAPTCDRRPVAIDLRNDWATALREAGFDPQAPTAWSAEGLLGYLSPDAQDRLLDTITDLSAPGSRVAIDAAPPSNPEEQEESREKMQTISQHWRDNGFDLDFGSLVYLGERNEASDYLTDHGWQVDRSPVNDLLAAGRRGTFDDDEPMGKLYYLSAIYGGAR